MFLYRFDTHPELVEGWTTDRRRVSERARAASSPRGGTAMYDAVAEAVPLAQRARTGRRRSSIISDGNDTSSQHGRVATASSMIRETEVLVYAIGIDGTDTQMTGGAQSPPAEASCPSRPRNPIPLPFPFPGRRTPPIQPPPSPQPCRRGRRPRTRGGVDDRVNVAACGTSPTTAADARRSFARRAISIRRPPASPTN